MSDQIAARYDEFPYPANPYPQTHPGRVAAVAALYGLQAPPVTNCRVLELGAAQGGNLLPMAVGLPDSEFVGVELSPRQVETGHQLLQSLQLGNVKLLEGDITHLDPGLGKFDYIIAHGFLSWVPPAVQQRMFAICREFLTPQGVAYVSYNTYPGWAYRMLLRKVLMRYASDVSDVKRVERSRAVIEYFSEALSESREPHAELVKQHLQELRELDDGFLLHDEYSLSNTPFYFHEFAEQAARNGLQYLGESELHGTPPDKLLEELPAWSGAGDDRRLEVEQWFDLVENRSFRHSLICHQELTLRYVPDSSAIRQLYVASALQRAESRPDGTVIYEHPDGRQAPVAEPLADPVLETLHRHWPVAVPFADLMQGIESSRQGEVADFLLEAARLNLVELHATPSPFTCSVSSRPVANPLARVQASDSNVVTSGRHVQIGLDSLHGRIVQLLDGERDLPAMMQQLDEDLAAGTLQLGQPQDEPQSARLRQHVPQCLQRLADAALLIR